MNGSRGDRVVAPLWLGLWVLRPGRPQLGASGCAGGLVAATRPYGAVTSLREASLRRKAAEPLRGCRAYSPAAARSAAALSVRSQENSGSSRPKCPYAAVFS